MAAKGFQATGRLAEVVFGRNKGKERVGQLGEVVRTYTENHKTVQTLANSMISPNCLFTGHLANCHSLHTAAFHVLTRVPREEAG